MPDLFIQGALAALLQVIVIDLTLAGDNAIVIGLAAAGLPHDESQCSRGSWGLNLRWQNRVIPFGNLLVNNTGCS